MELVLHASNPVPQRERMVRSAGVSAREDQASVALYVLDDPGSGVRWRIRLYAELAEHFPLLVGELYTYPNLDPVRAARLVATAGVPGARGWIVEGSPLDVPVGHERRLARVLLTASPEPLSGLHVIPDRAQYLGGRYETLANVLPPGLTIVAMPPRSFAVALAVWQSGTGGYIQYPDAGSPHVPLPPNGAVSLRPDGRELTGGLYCADIPAGGGGYVIEYLY